MTSYKDECWNDLLDAFTKAARHADSGDIEGVLHDLMPFGATYYSIVVDNDDERATQARAAFRTVADRLRRALSGFESPAESYAEAVCRTVRENQQRGG